MLVFWGVISGLGAALAHAVAYLLSRRFLQRGAGGVLELMVTSHLLMGVAALVLLPVFWFAPPPASWGFLLPAAGAAGFYMAGQAGLFWALRRTEASRIAPLLGLKIIVLAVIVAVFQGQRLGPSRWTAVALSVAAAFLLNEVGGRIPWQSAVGLLAAIVGYSLSDLSIVALVRRLAPAGAWAPLLGVCFSYLLCGLVSVPLLRFTTPLTGRVWHYAWPYAAAWFAAMILLYICFAAIGVVFGNIMQSTRGLIAILLVPLVAGWGLTHLETSLSRAVFWKRVLGALLMLSAIALYVAGG